MANKNLFQSLTSLLPRATARTRKARRRTGCRLSMRLRSWLRRAASTEPSTPAPRTNWTCCGAGRRAGGQRVPGQADDLQP